MAEIIGFDVPVGVSDFGSSFAGFLLMLSIIVAIGLFAAWVVWYSYQLRLFNKKIVIFENISGQGWRNTQKDKARFLRLSKDGTEVLFLKKKKIPITAYGKKMGNNTYWFAIGQDGGWYNFILGDLDAKMGVLDIEPIDRDIKYISVAMRRNAAEDYGPKQTWMDKYGSWILGGLTMIIMFAGISYLVSQMSDVSRELAGAVKSFTQIVEPVQKALANVDAICSGGQGIKPA